MRIRANCRPRCEYRTRSNGPFPRAIRDLPRSCVRLDTPRARRPSRELPFLSPEAGPGRPPGVGTPAMVGVKVGGRVQTVQGFSESAGARRARVYQ